MRAFLGQVGGREVDRDPPAAAATRPIAASAAWTRSRLSATALSGRPTTRNLGRPLGDLHLHLDGARLQPQKRDRGDMRDHGPRRCTASRTATGTSLPPRPRRTPPRRRLRPRPGPEHREGTRLRASIVTNTPSTEQPRAEPREHVPQRPEPIGSAVDRPCGLVRAEVWVDVVESATRDVGEISDGEVDPAAQRDRQAGPPRALVDGEPARTPRARGSLRVEFNAVHSCPDGSSTASEAASAPAPQPRSTTTRASGRAATAGSRMASARRRGTKTPGANATRTGPNSAQPTTCSSGIPPAREATAPARSPGRRASTRSPPPRPRHAREPAADNAVTASDRSTAPAWQARLGWRVYDVDALRAHFPASPAGTAHFDGPGGTQTPESVGEAIRRR